MEPVTWLEVVKAQLKKNPGKSVKDIIPAARKQWAEIKKTLPAKKAAPKKMGKVKRNTKVIIITMYGQLTLSLRNSAIARGACRNSG